MNKLCPLGLIGNHSGVTCSCEGDRCMLWENDTCILKSFFMGISYKPEKEYDNKDVV